MLNGLKKLLKKEPKTVLALDIGEDKVDIVQVERSASGIRLVNFMRSPLPEGAVEDGLIIDSTFVSKIIKSMLHTLGISNCRITTSVWGKGTIVSLEKHPLMESDKLKESLREKAVNYLAFAGTDVLTDCFSIEEIAEDGQKKLSVILGISRKEIIDSHVETVKQAGCWVDSIGLGVLESLRGLYPTCYLNVAIIAVIESGIAYIFLVNRGIIKFLYTAVLELTGEEEKFIHKLGNEINKVISYTGKIDRIVSIEKIIIAGDVTISDNKHIEDALHGELGISVEVGNPLTGIEIPPNIKEQELLNATRGLGLALRAAGVKTFQSEINLLPVEETEEKELTGQIRQFIIGVVIVVAIVILGLASFRLFIGHIKKQTLLATEILNKPTPVIAELLGIEKGLEDGGKELIQVEKIIEGLQNRKWSEFLNELKVIIPKTARLTNIQSGKEGMIGLKGQAISQEVVFNFVKNLRESPYFKDIELKTVKDAGRGNNVFVEYSITGKLFFYLEKE